MRRAIAIMTLAATGVGALSLGGSASGMLATLDSHAESRMEFAKKPAVSWSGPRSKIDQREFHRVRDAAAWAVLWKRHTGDDAPKLIAHGSGILVPEIDFDRYEVIAFFRGSSTNNDGEVVESVARIGEIVRVRFDSYSFQTASFGPKPDTGAKVTPYGIWVLERTDGAASVEENAQGMKNGAPEWKERHRFEAVK